jgi:hypothetical protein
MAMRDLPLRKFAGVAAALALHIALIALLLRASLGPNPTGTLVHETILLLLPLKSKTEKTLPVSPHAQRAAQHYPDYSAITLPPLPITGTSEGLHLMLFDCLPENISNLSPERGARCAGASTDTKQDDSVDSTDHTGRSRDAAHWARGRLRKNGPLLLPCASNAGIGVGLGTLLCLAKGAANGFDLDNQEIYGDRPEDVHVPNGGDPPPVYVDPDH